MITYFSLVFIRTCTTSYRTKEVKKTRSISFSLNFPNFQFRFSFGSVQIQVISNASLLGNISASAGGVFVSSFLLKCYQYFKIDSKPWRLVSNLNQILTKHRSKHISETIVFSCSLFFALLVANAYSGGLASILTSPRWVDVREKAKKKKYLRKFNCFFLFSYEASIDTAKQLADSNMGWGATHDAWIFSISLATQPDIVKLLHLFQALPSQELVRLASTGDFSFSIERLPFGLFFLSFSICTRNFVLFSSDIFEIRSLCRWRLHRWTRDGPFAIDAPWYLLRLLCCNDIQNMATQRYCRRSHFTNRTKWYSTLLGIDKCQ